MRLLLEPTTQLRRSRHNFPAEESAMPRIYLPETKQARGPAVSRKVERSEDAQSMVADGSSGSERWGSGAIRGVGNLG
jgi:hypothetical protein